MIWESTNKGAQMARAGTDTTSEAQGRFVVSLPKEVGAQIDDVAEKLSRAMEAEAGIAFALSRAQVVQALVRQALRNGD
jgi:hypothetical protein